MVLDGDRAGVEAVLRELFAQRDDLVLEAMLDLAR
jgi:hypothetical protein